MLAYLLAPHVTLYDRSYMNGRPEIVLNWPNAVSILRILMAPVMLTLALLGYGEWFLAAALFSGFTDVVDGFLARRLNQITTFGSHLDSWGDFTVYSCMAAGAWLLWPHIVIAEAPWFIAIVLSFVVPALVGLMKFRAFTSYHTQSVKLAVFITFVGYLLLFTETDSTVFKIAAVACVIAAIEEIIITLLMHHQHVDVRNLKRAWRYHQQGE